MGSGLRCDEVAGWSLDSGGGGGGLRRWAAAATEGRVPPRGGPVRQGPAGRRMTRIRGRQAGPRAGAPGEIISGNQREPGAVRQCGRGPDRGPTRICRFTGRSRRQVTAVTVAAVSRPPIPLRACRPVTASVSESRHRCLGGAKTRCDGAFQGPHPATAATCQRPPTRTPGPGASTAGPASSPSRRRRRGQYKADTDCCAEG